MPRLAVETNSRMSLRIPAADKALLLRAAALQNQKRILLFRQAALVATGKPRKTPGVISRDSERLHAG
jgi:uncharacterized protein (DUF1778 family)